MLFQLVSYHNILFCEKVNMVFIFGWNFFKTVFLDWSLFDKHEVSNTLSYVQSSSNLHGTRPWSNFYRGVTWSGQYLVSCKFNHFQKLWHNFENFCKKMKNFCFDIILWILIPNLFAHDNIIILYGVKWCIDFTILSQ